MLSKITSIPNYSAIEVQDIFEHLILLPPKDDPHFPERYSAVESRLIRCKPEALPGLIETVIETPPFLRQLFLFIGHTPTRAKPIQSRKAILTKTILNNKVFINHLRDSLRRLADPKKSTGEKASKLIHVIRRERQERQPLRLLNGQLDSRGTRPTLEDSFGTGRPINVLRLLNDSQPDYEFALHLQKGIRALLKKMKIDVERVDRQLQKELSTVWEKDYQTNEFNKKLFRRVFTNPSKKTLMTSLRALLDLPPAYRCSPTGFTQLVEITLHLCNTFDNEQGSSSTEETKAVAQLIDAVFRRGFTSKDPEQLTLMKKRFHLVQSCLYSRIADREGTQPAQLKYHGYCCRLFFDNYPSLAAEFRARTSSTQLCRKMGITTGKEYLLGQLLVFFPDEALVTPQKSRRRPVSITHLPAIIEQSPRTPTRIAHRTPRRKLSRTFTQDTPRSKRERTSPDRYRDVSTSESPTKSLIRERMLDLAVTSPRTVMAQLREDKKELEDLLNTRNMLWVQAGLNGEMYTATEQQKVTTLESELKDLEDKISRQSREYPEDSDKGDLLRHCLELTKICRSMETELQDIKSEQKALKDRLDEFEPLCTRLHQNLVEVLSERDLAQVAFQDATANLVKDFTSHVETVMKSASKEIKDQVIIEMENSQTLAHLNEEDLPFEHQEIIDAYGEVYKAFFIYFQSKLMTQFVIQDGAFKLEAKGRHKVTETIIGLIPEFGEGVDVMKSVAGMIQEHTMTTDTKKKANSITASLSSAYKIPMVAKKLTERVFADQQFQEAFETYYLSLSSKKRNRHFDIAQKLFHRYKKHFPIAEEIRGLKRLSISLPVTYAQAVPEPGCLSCMTRGPRLRSLEEKEMQHQDEDIVLGDDEHLMPDAFTDKSTGQGEKRRFYGGKGAWFARLPSTEMGSKE